MTEPIEPTKTPEPMVPTEPTEASQTTEADDGVNPVRRFRRTRRVLAKIPHPPLRSKRGLFVLFLLIAGFGTIAGAGSVMAIHFSETSKFCGMCHTMDPELKAYAMSPHKDVTCAECHVEPGVAGFIKAKANGTKQLLGIITGKYPTPIPPPDHADLPSVKDSCLACHEADKLTENGGPVKLVLRARYKPDETNTRESIAIMLRPAGLGQPSAKEGASPDGAEGGVRGVHWHIQQKVTYTSGDEHAQKIDLVEITGKDGATKQYIAGSKVAVSTDVQVDVDGLKLSQKSRVMDCIDCHNRVGHAVPSPERAVDEAMSDGEISTALPFIKRDSVALLKGHYPTLEAADAAINGLRTSYATRYPLVLKNHDEQVTGAIDELKHVYRLVATPAMKVQAKTYPDNLGHQTSPGCFRCHDDAHFLVVKGKVTNKKIPSACATCHTFPQVGASASSASSFPLGAKPVDHKDKLYVFSHKNSVKSSDPAGTTCAGCHAPSYCQNCHSSGAIKVKHTAMSYNHADVIRKAGSTQSCAYCHLPVYCEKCHKKPVLEPASLPPGVIGKPKP